MAVAEADLEQIVAHVKANIHDILLEAVPRFAVGSRDVLERILRVEEELKNQRGVMETRFAAVDKRFEDVNKRFEDLQGYLGKRLDSVDKRFEDMNKRFEDLQGYLDKRLDSVDKRFEDMNKRFNGTQWMIGGVFAVLTTLITLYQFLS